MVPLRRNVFFDSSFFSASRSWVPIVDAEPSLRCQALGPTSVEAVSCVGWRVFPPWCLAERRLGTLCVDNVALQASGSVFTQAEKPSRMDEKSSS